MCDVDIATGIVFQTNSDLFLPGIPEFRVRRDYSSQRKSDSALGPGWTHNAAMDLRLLEGGDAIFTAGSGSWQLPEGKSTAAAKRTTSTHGPDVLEVSTLGRLELVQRANDWWQVDRQILGPGNWRRFFYHGERLTGIVDSAGREVTFSYLGNRLRSITASGKDLSLTASYTFDVSGRLTEIRDVLGHTQTYSYQSHYVVSYTDQTGATRFYAYDTQGRCIFDWYDCAARVRALDFRADGRTISVLDSFGNRYIFETNEHGKLTSVTDPLGQRSEWQYDASGALLSSMTAKGTTRDLAIWTSDQRLQAFDVRGFQTTYVYRDGGLEIENGDGQTLSLRRNEYGLFTDILMPNGGNWHFDFSPDGFLTAVTNPTGYRTWRKKDESGVITSGDANGPLTTLFIDGAGDLRWDIDAEGRRTSYEYGGQGRLDRLVRADGSSTRWTYDGRGRILSVTDGLGRSTTYQYNPFGSEVARIFPDGKQISTVLDAEEHLLELVNTLGEETRLEYDDLGRNTKIIFFDGRTDSHTFDPMNQIVLYTDSSGAAYRYEYDGANNPTQVIFPDLTQERRSYNALENLVEIQATGADGELVAALKLPHTPNGYLAGEEGEHKVVYTYDLANNITKIEDDTGRAIDYILDDRGFIRTLRDGADEYRLTYSRTGEIVEVSYPGGMRQALSYDLCARLARRDVFDGSNNLLASREFRYDAADQLTQIRDSAGGAAKFEYDQRGRLSKADGLGRHPHYHWDSEGNLLSGPEYGAASFLPGNRLAFAGAEQFEYDSLGRLVALAAQDGTRWEYSYDYVSRLVEVRLNNSLRATYEYDLLGRRTAKVTAAGRSTFLYHGNALMREDSPEWGCVEYLYIPFTFIPLAQRVNGKLYFHSWDQGGCPTEVWAAQGELAAKVSALPFGERRSVVFSGPPLPVPMHFPGQYVDSETGLFYNRFRYYHPATARYITQDPFGLAIELNLYKYPNNPLTWIDPLGLAGLTLKIKCAPGDPPPFTPCEQAALQKKIELMNNNLQNQNRKARCTDCRTNEQRDYFKEKCGGTVPAGWQVDHIQELQVGGGDKCCTNLMAIPARPNGSCGSQIYHQVKDFGGSVVGAMILPPGCSQASRCKSGGTRVGTGPDAKSCEEPDPITC